MLHRIAPLFSFACLLSAQAQDCATLIELSKTISYRVVDQSAFDQEAATFCSAYSRNASTTSDTNFAAAFKFLSASFGQENTSAESIASKVCSTNSRASASANAYRDYVNTIAPGAYDAYKTCVSSRDSLQFSVDLASILPTEFTLTANYRQSTNSPALLRSTPSAGIQCEWDEGGGRDVTLGGTGDSARRTAALTCKRTDPTVRSYVTVINTLGTERINLPWRKYNKDGDPVDTVASLETKLQKAVDEIAALNASLTALRASVNALGSRLSSNTLRTSIPTTQMVNLRARCDPSDIACLAATSRYCQSQGYQGGFPQEWNDSQTILVCVGK